MKTTICIRRSAVAFLLALAASSPAWSQGATPPLRVLRPVPNAVVRETVPVRVTPGDLPSDGYVGVTIDDVFRTARVLPEKRAGGLIFEWDTKAPYSTTDDPDTQKYVSDGEHTLKIDLYDHSGNLQGEATIPLRVANKISVPAQGIKLAYRWRTDQALRYVRQSQLDAVTNGTATSTQNLQAALIRFSRSVEDASGADFLIRDTVLPNSFLISRGLTQRLEAAYNIKSKYRTVDTRGDVLREQRPLTPGQHIAFSIPVLPARRVAVGDSWQSPVQVSLDWAATDPASITAESRLEGFEWQNGYPTAKIRETYTGPITFHSGGATSGGGTPFGATSGSANGSFDAQNVKYERLVYFAYNSGRLVRSQTSMTMTADLTSAVSSALGIGAGGGGYGGFGGGGFGGGMANAYQGLLNEEEGGGGPPAGSPGFSGPPPGFNGGPPPGSPGFGGGFPGGGPPFAGGGFPGGPPFGGGGYPGGPPFGGGYPGGPGRTFPTANAQPAQPTTVTIKATDITNLAV